MERRYIKATATTANHAAILRNWGHEVTEDVMKSVTTKKKGVHDAPHFEVLTCSSVITEADLSTPATARAVVQQFKQGALLGYSSRVKTADGKEGALQGPSIQRISSVEVEMKDGSVAVMDLTPFATKGDPSLKQAAKSAATEARAAKAEAARDATMEAFDLI